MWNSRFKSKSNGSRRQRAYMWARSSSMVILSGTWEFFDDEDFKGTKIATLGPGRYPKVADKGIKNK